MLMKLYFILLGVASACFSGMSCEPRFTTGLTRDECLFYGVLTGGLLLFAGVIAWRYRERFEQKAPYLPSPLRGSDVVLGDERWLHRMSQDMAHLAIRGELSEAEQQRLDRCIRKVVALASVTASPAVASVLSRVETVVREAYYRLDYSLPPKLAKMDLVRKTLFSMEGLLHGVSEA